MMMGIRKLLDFVFSRSEMYWLDHIMPGEERIRMEDERGEIQAHPYSQVRTARLFTVWFGERVRMLHGCKVWGRRAILLAAVGVPLSLLAWEKFFDFFRLSIEVRGPVPSLPRGCMEDQYPHYNRGWGQVPPLRGGWGPVSPIHRGWGPVSHSNRGWGVMPINGILLAEFWHERWTRLQPFQPAVQKLPNIVFKRWNIGDRPISDHCQARQDKSVD